MATYMWHWYIYARRIWRMSEVPPPPMPILLVTVNCLIVLDRLTGNIHSRDHVIASDRCPIKWITSLPPRWWQQHTKRIMSSMRREKKSSLNFWFFSLFLSVPLNRLIWFWTFDMNEKGRSRVKRIKTKAPSQPANYHTSRNWGTITKIIK